MVLLKKTMNAFVANSFLKRSGKYYIHSSLPHSVGWIYLSGKISIIEKKLRLVNIARHTKKVQSGMVH